YLAFCGELFDLSLQLPFTDFLPKTVHVGLIIKGENVFCRFYLPENNTSRHVIKALAENMKIIDREGNIMSKQFGHQTNKQWRRFTNKDSGWIDCWSTTNVALSIGYMYHPMPLLVDSYRQTGSAMMEGLITTPELEEALLIPLRPIKGSSTEALPPSDFDPSTMEADVISVELEVAPSVLCLYGSLLRNFLHVKENYLGENQIYRDFQDMVSSPKEVEVGIGPFSGSDVETAPFDARDYRPFSVTVSVTLHDIQGHLVKVSSLDDIPCPCVHVQRLGFEMNKSYQQTKLQLLLSPAVLIAKDNVERMSDQKLLKEGHIGLSGLQVRGHAMFSDEGLSLDTETLEYGWLMEAVIGDITGKLTSPQLQNIIEFLQTAIMLVEDPENRLQPQVPYSLCQHMLPQPSCRMLSTYPFQCPSMDEIKYRMTRVSVDSINFFLVESGSALNLQVYPIRISTCNLHGTTTRAGITALVEKVFLKQYIATAALKHETSQPDTWMESGGMSLGPINVEAAMALPYPEFHSLQDAFLKLHDKKTERLWFLWPHPSTEISAAVVGKCGCHGGCKFFGMNRNGIGFFHPRKHKDSIPSVAVQESPEGADPGFGHSLLHKDRHVFSDIPSDNEVSSNGASSSKEFSFTRGYMSNLASPDFPLTNMTILEDQNTSDSSTMCRRSSVGGSSLEPVACVSSGTDSSLVPSEYLPDDPMPDPFDSDMTGNTTSDNTSWTLDNISLTTPTSPSTRSFTSEHTHNQDHLRCTKSSVSMPSSPPSAYRRDSKVSPFSGESMSALFMKTPSQTSLPGSSLSPHLTDSRDSLRLNSTASLESERFYSADEEMLSTSYDSHGFLSAQDKAGHSDLDQIMFGATPGRNPDETVIAMERTVLKRQVSSSSSTSTLSYMSADSEPSSDDGTLSGDMPEDFSLVDLHGQMNKPITNSTVLMSSYSNHLTCLQCNDWSVPVPVKPSLMKFDQSYYSLSSVGQSIQYIHGPACMPHFNKVRTGFSTSLMEEKTNMLQEPPPLGFRGSSNLWLPPEEESQNEDDSNETMLLQNTSKTTAVIKVKGSMDIMLTPLFLESFQRYADAVVPTLDTLHPSSIIDGLHTRCLDRLKCQNRLKKSEDNFDLNSPQQEEVKSMTENSFDGHQRTEETRTSSLQALFTLSKINICVLQSGIVEEVISFSALDDLNQITCVSLLGICIDDIKCQLLSNSHSLKTVQIQDTSPMTVPKINNSPRKRKSKKKTATKGEQVTPEREKEQVSEINQEEDVGTLSIARIHTQLRRLIKNDSLNDDMILTAIPESQSKVLFQYKKEVAESMSEVTMRRKPSLCSTPDQKSDTFSNLPFGFIMFENGLEEVKITAVRRLGYKGPDDLEFQNRMENIEIQLHKIQNQTRTQLESETGEKPATVPDTNLKPNTEADNNSTDSIHSWDSRISIPSSASTESNEDEPLRGDASSGVLELKTIWLNFAAPPPTSIKRKLDFTRLDWNLLSTVTPAINAWLSPLDRLMMSLNGVVRALTHRTCTVMACIMTDGLEIQGIHMPYKSKFSKTTSLSKTLQEDPSSQLLTVLRKYLHRTGIQHVENAVEADTLPQLITIQKGILALTRQWKNVLYMPQLSEMNFKSRKSVRPYTVSFALPVEPCDHDDGEGTVEHFDVVDEKTSLLQAEGGSLHHETSLQSFSGHGAFALPKLHGVTMDSNLDVASSASAGVTRPRKLSGYPGTGKAPYRPSTPVLGGVDSPERIFNINLQRLQTLSPPVILSRNESNYSFMSVPSVCSLDHGAEGTPPQTPLRLEPPKPSSILKNKAAHNQDLYRWMSKQPGEFKSSITDDHQVTSRQDSFLAAFGSTWSQGDSKTDINAEHVTMATSIMQLADAQSLFKPFLQSIGLHVESVRPSAMMKKFGGSLSLQSKLDIFKIQIASSDLSHTNRKGKSGAKSRKPPKLLNVNADLPAFLCDSFAINVAMKDVIDFEKHNGDDNIGTSKFSLNFAMHKLEAKPTTLQVNFLMNCQSVTQHVDMPLLRLLHQFIMMVENLNTTRKDLKKSHSNIDWLRTHRKQNSKDSTSSADTQQSEMSQKRDTTSSSDNQAVYTTSSSDNQGKVPQGASNVVTPPQSLNLSDSITIDLGDTSSPTYAEKTIVDEIKESTPKCWKTLYHLLELYSTMPETKTVTQKRDIAHLPVIEEEPETSRDVKSDMVDSPSDSSIYIGESIPLVVFGIAKVERVKILAVLSGLKLEAELKNVHASGTYKEKVKGFLNRKSAESSVTAHIGNTMIILLEGIPPNMQSRQSFGEVATTETSIPSQASIDLPPIHVYADFRYYKANVPVAETLTEGLILKEGNYLNAVAEVGMLEHSLTTDLLNHLVFVQKVFMKEVNEVVQKVSGSDQPVPLWAEGGPQIKSSMGQVLYSLLFRFKGIQITATTPTSSAVRLETGSVDLEMSNRVQLAVRDESADLAYGDSKKVFIKAQIDLNLALGQLLKNPMFEEAEPEFQTMAFFKTKIGIRNALQDEMIPGVSTDQEALLITVKRPILLAQPLAFDKAVLVWLNYKNAYEYWAEQRMALNREVQTATRQVIDRLPQFTPTAPQALSTLFLQLTVDDLGICVPVVNQVSTAPPTSRLIDSELTSALVLTIESTQISACSKGSLVSKGKFKAFCLRFADDFETSWDDWKPNPEEEPLNGCTVTEGTYEVCSRTINKLPSDPTGNAKWIMNVRWEMQGSDLHLDTNIGKRLSALGHTLTALAGEQEEEFPETEDDADFLMTWTGRHLKSFFKLEYYLRKGGAMADALPDFVFDSTMDPKQRARLVEKEMNEQAKIVQDLRQLGASQSTIEQENRKLEELQNILFNDFRREVLNRIKRQSERTTNLHEKVPQLPQSPTDATSEPSSQFGTTPLIRTGSKHRTSIPVDSSRNRHSSGQSSSKSSTWETLVMFAINLSRLDVNVNMSNVMGNTVWATSSVKSQGRLSIDSSGHKDLRITAGMEGSHFESKGGVVGGTIDLQNMDTFLEVSEDPELGREPDHRAGLSMSIIEGRIDYMGSSVLMTRLSDLSVLLRDEWRISTRTDSDIPLATNRPALLFAHGDLGWDKFHILISRSTTSDLIKMVSKLEEFFTNQFASSKRVLSSFGSMPGTTKLKNVEKRKTSLSEARHHHHWHSALEHAAGCEFRMLKSILPKIGTILGGTMTLRGNNLSLACFHGINFRSKSWAVFMMNEPYICFATEAQKMAAGGEKSFLDFSVHIVQDLTFYVGHEQTHLTPGKHMATICKLSRGHSLPHPFNSVQEWFHYAFASADIKGEWRNGWLNILMYLDQFPAMQNECSENPSEYKKSRKSQEYNHDTEMIFALPSLQLQLKTFHLQGESEPSLEDPHPVVECSFVTEFEDHIFVAMDAEAILFLHDLVSSYIKEKERAGTRSSHSSKSAKSPDLERKKMTDPTTVLKQDCREFECKTWHLEPTVRLLHWASTQIDPVGADYILQKLGFTHARVTIPKWVQRGFMDPLDKFLSLLVDGIIVTLRVRPQTEDENDSKK
ncbi:hypothetical protein ScPMuIL_009945, partial [Solemya velum]